jgi:hypothetical protein
MDDVDIMDDPAETRASMAKRSSMGPQARRDDAVGGYQSADGPAIPAALAGAHFAGTFWRFSRTNGAFGYLSPARLFGGGSAGHDRL